MTLNELNTLVAGLWAKVKSYISTVVSSMVTKSELASYNPIIEDTRTEAESQITAVAPFASLTDKQMIVIRLHHGTNNQTTINLTLSDGTTTGAKPVFIGTPSAASLTQVKGNNFRAGMVLAVVFDVSNDQWVCVSQLDTNTTYSALTQAEINAGTSTTNKVVSAKLLRDNFYIKSEIDTKIGDIETLLASI